MRLFFLLIILFPSCANDPDLVKDFFDKENLFVERIEGAEILYTERGLLNVKIIANTIERFQTQPELVLSNNLEVTFYNDSALVESVLRGGYAEINEEKNIMTIYDNVILSSVKGKKLETEELVWDEIKQQIFTDKRVVITTQKEIINGAGFTSTPDFSKYFISEINGIVNIENLNK